MHAPLLALLLLTTTIADTPRVEVRNRRRVVTNAPPPSASTATMNVLIVGNSLTYFNEMPWMLGEIATSKQTTPPLHVEFSGGSGMTLQQHWEKGEAQRRIEQGRWDFVVLQAQSSEAVRAPEPFREYARRFDSLIRKHGARTVIVETWAIRDAPYSQRQYRAQYETLARELRATLAPVGAAWQQLLGRHIELFDSSGVHPNVLGSYLYASVLYDVCTGRNAKGATHTFDVHYGVREAYRQSLEHDRIDDATAAAIQDAAWAAVQASR